jgi:hypothetical protein
MRFIAKQHEPRELLQWKAENAETPHILKYGGGGFPMEQVRQALLSEQSHLCAYTMKPLRTPADCAKRGNDTRDACHIEHVRPQSRRVEGEDIDYQNMVACFPPSLHEQACEFGAKYKDDFDPVTGRYLVRHRMNKAKHEVEALALRGQFVSPLTQQVENHFAYSRNGEMAGTTDSGKLTVAVLNLNHVHLVNDRRAAIKGALAPGGKRLSAAKARALARHCMQPDAHNRATPYFVAIAAAALAFAVQEEKRAARIKGARAV